MIHALAQAARSNMMSAQVTNKQVPCKDSNGQAWINAVRALPTRIVASLASFLLACASFHGQSRACGEYVLSLQVPQLLNSIAQQSHQHQEMLLRMGVTAVESYADPRSAHLLDAESNFAASQPFLQQAQDRKVFLSFALKVILYQLPASLIQRSAPGRLSRLNSSRIASRSEVLAFTSL